MLSRVNEETGLAAALVLGAGRGERLGHALPKAFVPLAGSPLIELSIRALEASGCFSLILPVLARADFGRFEQLGLGEIPALDAPVEGGAERQHSLAAGLAALPPSVGWVAVHDAARCLVSTADIQRVVRAAREEGAAILGARVGDTIKLVDEEGRILETPPRDRCWAAQTPQVLRRDWLEEAATQARLAGRLGTDDAQLLEWAGHPVRMVEATAPNPKITRPEDLVAAEAILAERAYRRGPASPVGGDPDRLGASR